MISDIEKDLETKEKQFLIKIIDFLLDYINFAEKEIVDNTIDDILILLDHDNNGYIEYEEFF